MKHRSRKWHYEEGTAPLAHFPPCGLARDMLVRVLLTEGAGEQR